MHFTINDLVLGLSGGVLIGLAAAILVVFKGRVLGVSGILAALLQPPKAAPQGHYAWRLLFLAGIGTVGLVGYIGWGDAGLQQINGSPGLLILAGLLVGVGTRLGSGCTSGHGVCGLARLSVRSLVATCTFITSGMVTTYLVLHVL